MAEQTKRAAKRIKVNIRALVTDRDETKKFDCDVLDASVSGCRIESRQLNEIPDEIRIQVQGLDVKTDARIVWRKVFMAGVAFEWEGAEKNDKRSHKRFKANVPAVAADRAFEQKIDCRIRDASQAGCRITSDQIDLLPDEICIQIKGLTEPIDGKIVWRKPGTAGVQLEHMKDVFELD